MARKNWRIKASKPAKAEKDKPRPFTAASGKACVIAAEGGEQKTATFEGNAYTGAVMQPSGWWGRLVVDLDGVRVPSEQRPVLRQHDHEQIVGHTTKVNVEKDGIKVAGVFSGEPQHTSKVTVPAKNGFAWQLSIGADPVRTEFLEDGAETEVNGETVTGPVTISRETELGEISFVPLGADGNTSATVSASRGGRQMKKKFQAAFKAYRATGSVAAGKYNDDEIDKMSEDDAKAALKKCMAADEKESESADDDGDDSETDTETKPEATKASAKKAIRAEIDRELKLARSETVTEMRRQNEITVRAQKYGGNIKIELDGKKVDLVPHAIEAGWTPDQVELHALRQHRPSEGVGGPTVYVTSQPEMNEAVLEAAVFQALRCPVFDDGFFEATKERDRVPKSFAATVKADIKRRYPEKVMDAAHEHFKGRIGLQQLFTIVAKQNGYRGRETISDDNYGEVAQHCMRIHADGSSTISVQNLTANVLNKFLLTGYLFTEMAWMEVSARRATKDFKPTKSINLFGDVEFKDVGNSGELDNATLQDQAFANQVKTRGRMLTIGRPTIINDDLGGLGQVPMIMGRGAGLKLNKEFWKIFLSPGLDDGGDASPTTNFFAATHTLGSQKGNSNLSSGAGSTLASAGLTAATLLFDKQVDPMGYPLGLDAEILLYPPDLQTAALQLMNSEYIIMDSLGSTSSSKVQPSSNIWKGRYRPVKSRYLSNADYTGYSALSWYLLANPALLPCIEVAFLNGQEMPTVQTAGPDFQFNILGLSTRAFFDMGVNMQNFRGGVKSAGS